MSSKLCHVCRRPSMPAMKIGVCAYHWYKECSGENWANYLLLQTAAPHCVLPPVQQGTNAVAWDLYAGHHISHTDGEHEWWGLILSNVHAASCEEAALGFLEAASCVITPAADPANAVDKIPIRVSLSHEYAPEVPALAEWATIWVLRSDLVDDAIDATCVLVARNFGEVASWSTKILHKVRAPLNPGRSSPQRQD